MRNEYEGFVWCDTSFRESVSLFIKSFNEIRWSIVQKRIIEMLKINSFWDAYRKKVRILNEMCLLIVWVHCWQYIFFFCSGYLFFVRCKKVNLHSNRRVKSQLPTFNGLFFKKWNPVFFCLLQRNFVHTNICRFHWIASYCLVHPELWGIHSK